MTTELAVQNSRSQCRTYSATAATITTNPGLLRVDPANAIVTDPLRAGQCSVASPEVLEGVDDRDVG